MEGEVTSIWSETENIKGFFIKTEKAFSYTPGQYVMLSLDDEPECKRAFSVVSFDKEKKELFLLIKKAGYFTSRLFSAKEGVKVHVHGPYGRFCLPKEEKPVVLIAGGVGITPLYSMLHHIKNSEYGNKAHLYYSAKRKDDMVLLERIESLKDPRIMLNLFFTQEKRETHRSGRISADMIRDEVPDFNNCLYYICGPKVMIDDMRNALISNEVSEELIRSEEFH